MLETIFVFGVNVFMILFFSAVTSALFLLAGREFLKDLFFEEKSQVKPSHPIDYMQLRLKENYDKLNAKARKGMN